MGEWGRGPLHRTTVVSRQNFGGYKEEGLTRYEPLVYSSTTVETPLFTAEPPKVTKKHLMSKRSANPCIQTETIQIKTG